MVARQQEPSPAGVAPCTEEPARAQFSEPPVRIRHVGLFGRVVNLVFRPRSIRGKLIRILCVSIALVLALLGFVIANGVGTFRAASRTARITSVTLDVQWTVHELQAERGLTNGLLGGDPAFRDQLTAQRPRTDAALAHLGRVIGDSANDDAGAARVGTALSKLDTLRGVRSAVDHQTADAATTFQFYTEAIGALTGIELGLDQTSDNALRRGLQALYALGDITEDTGQERGLLSGVFAANTFSQADYATFAQVLGAKRASIADYRGYASPTESAALDAALGSASAASANGMRTTAIDGVDGQLPARVDPQVWWHTTTTVMDDLRTVGQSVGQDVRARAVTLRAQAGGLLAGLCTLALLIILIMIGMIVGAARSVIDPIRLLARDADDMSVRRLPEAVARLQSEESGDLGQPVLNLVPSDAATEISMLARALDRLQDTALNLATEQAVIRRNTTASLANLGRRNQNLVRRQLALISDFERDEMDPAALANMFELDHLATRMRRNAESVLVLVGQTSTRTWSQPLPIADVIRAALSEVEDYRRVVLRTVDPASVVGSVITDVAHMLAELVENGLAFSAPELEVEIYGRRTDDGYLLVVVDHGIGMTADELATARARLRDEENYLVAPTRFLGHYVVGRLAKRLGVRVELSESPVTGLTTRLLLPAELITDDAGMPIETPPADGTETAHSAAEPNPIPAARSAVEPPMSQPEPARTTNGLVKRQSRRHMRTPTIPATSPAPQGTERSPSQVRSMLSAFRQGHQRGQLAVSGVGSAAGTGSAEASVTPRSREEETGEH